MMPVDTVPMTWRQAFLAMVIYGSPLLAVHCGTAQAMTCAYTYSDETGEWFDPEHPACNLGRLRPSAKGLTPMCGTRSQVQVMGPQRSAIRRVSVYPVTVGGRPDIVINTYVEGYLPLVVCIPAHWMEFQMVVDCRPDESPVYYAGTMPEWGITTVEVCNGE